MVWTRPSSTRSQCPRVGDEGIAAIPAEKDDHPWLWGGGAVQPLAAGLGTSLPQPHSWRIWGSHRSQEARTGRRTRRRSRRTTPHGSQIHTSSSRARRPPAPPGTGPRPPSRRCPQRCRRAVRSTARHTPPRAAPAAALFDFGRSEAIPPSPRRFCGRR